MKFVSSALLALSVTAALPTLAAGTLPDKGVVAFNKIYAVEGFDSNDNVQVVGVGRFPNSCFRNAETQVKVDHAKKIIQLTPLAYKYGGYCLQVMMPFDRVVDVGLLQPGTYTVVQANSPQPLAQINIHPTTRMEADDELYAPISQAFFQAAPGANKVVLTGEFPLSCMKMKQVKFNVQPDVLVVQPVAEVAQGASCKKGSFPFTVTTDVGAMKPGRYVMHIRSMNGKAVSSLIDAQ